MANLHGAESSNGAVSSVPRRLAIAHVLSSFKVGGAEQVVVDLATLQCDLGHEVLAIAIADDPDGPRADQLRRRGVDVHLLPKRPGFDITMIARLAALFAGKKVTLVHSHNHLPLIYAAPAGWLHRVPVIHTKHGVSQDMQGRRWLRSAVAPFVDAHVAVSDSTAEHLLGQRKTRPPNLHIISNGIDLSRFAPDPEARARVRAELGVSQQAWVVGCVGRLCAVKNHALLLRAAARSLADGGRLLLVGDGPERALLMTLSRELGLSGRVIFLGERHDVPRLLTALDVFALPSLSEGMPLVVIEAMSTALPVVATAVGGVPTVLADEETGFLVPSGDAEALAVGLAALRDDPALAERMGRSGRKIALQRYSAARMVERYMNLYALLLTRQLPRGEPFIRPSSLFAWHSARKPSGCDETAREKRREKNVARRPMAH
jgi:sugar transferase (PEP-CTERM/EpsH1 system associated)